MFELSTGNWLLACCAAFMVGFSKTGITGTGMIVIPVMAGIFPAKDSVGILLPLLCVGDLFAVIWYKRYARWPLLLPLIPWVLLGVIVAYLIAGKISSELLRPVIGLIVITVLGLALWRERKERSVPLVRWPIAGAVGISAGITTMLANAAGPIMAIYLLMMRLPMREFIGTGAWYFFLINLFKIPLMVDLGTIHSASLAFDLKMTPLVILGALTGRKLVGVIPEKIFKRCIQVVTFAAALKLLF
ncbi:MAG: sulfite exporter TauE/SafE family protein [Planctomycetes bacterium]|nr:sulfite exporter TauE/SafE family protein [Planctomycetota bacterium]